MIEFLRDWIEQIAIAVIIVSIFEMILPNGKTKKYIQIILGIFIVFSIISPFVDSSALYNLDVDEIIENYTDEIEVSSSTSSSIDENIEEMYITELENEIKATVEEQGYNVTKCEVDAVIYSDDEDAGINSINIIVSSRNSNYYLKDTESSNIEEINQVEISVSTGNELNNENAVTDSDIKNLKKYLSDYYEIDKKVININ